MQQTLSPTRTVVILASLSAIAAFSIDTYIPAIPTMARALSAPIHKVELSISTFFIGYALGQLFGGPLSDRLGRRRVALMGLSLFLVASFLLIFSRTVWELLSLRTVQAVGGGFATVVAGATVRDLYEGREGARMMSLVQSVTMGAPLVAPAVGTVLLAGFSWHAIFLFLCVYALFLMAVLTRHYPGEERPVQAGAPMTPTGVARQYASVLLHPVSPLFMLVHTFGCGGLYAFLTESAFMYMGYFHVSKALFPVLFSSGVGVVILLARLNARLVRHVRPMTLLTWGILIQVICGMALAVQATWFVPVLWVTVALNLLFIGSLGLVMGNTVSGNLQYFPEKSGTAHALMGVINCFGGAVAGITVSHFHDGSLRPLAWVMCVSALCAFGFLGILRRRVRGEV
ncbi:multidrug effflux MFS transporter [Desulfoluna spongiiphila]|uniref:MFS transporter, DHA1 family, bicyclomycin/chloramphenicol resistance protein n=1 Tax=Desulfoluna spongiiphila TaxID=419481 RepID=A0A1G5HLE5_9BACT|nr:multidrug effflux MFS transporter [Desulfoluna spongiiphila]SCY63878.1 MFS transporter, DHA1 family, bicyclomycin/chloramphenicol resistance protein [Desulfoluna spongiiphila]VVS93485.1 mfs transporter superfamily [Desulfoluna spongiiphila]